MGNDIGKPRCHLAVVIYVGFGAYLHRLDGRLLHRLGLRSGNAGHLVVKVIIANETRHHLDVAVGADNFVLINSLVVLALVAGVFKLLHIADELVGLLGFAKLLDQQILEAESKRSEVAKVDETHAWCPRLLHFFGITVPCSLLVSTELGKHHAFPWLIRVILLQYADHIGTHGFEENA